jgi:outer membrane protein assembly factor BamB
MVWPASANGLGEYYKESSNKTYYAHQPNGNRVWHLEIDNR